VEGLAVYIDVEHALDPTYAARCGVRADELLVSQPDSGEQALEIAESVVRKYHYAPEFYAALLNNQPMGFYTPEVIVGDAKRHDVEVLPVHINKSRGRCIVEEGTVRLGFRYVKGMGEAAIAGLEGVRDTAQFTSVKDFYQRVRPGREATENLILVGAMDCFGQPKRQLLWQLGLLEREGRDELPSEFSEYQIPLPGRTQLEELAADYRIQGLSARDHPMKVLRPSISRDGVLKSSEVMSLFSESKVRIAGYVVYRQSPRTAKGHVFLTIEDEDGLVNVVLKPHVYRKHRYVARRESLIVVEGILQKGDGVINIVAYRLAPLREERERQRTLYPSPPKARDFASAVLPSPLPQVHLCPSPNQSPSSSQARAATAGDLA